MFKKICKRNTLLVDITVLTNLQAASPDKMEITLNNACTVRHKSVKVIIKGNYCSKAIHPTLLTVYGTRKQNCSDKMVSFTPCRVCQLFHSEALQQSKSLFQFKLLIALSSNYSSNSLPYLALYLK